jgi:hypothetical protein
MASSSTQTQFSTPPAIVAFRQLVEPPSAAQTHKNRWKGKEQNTLLGKEIADYFLKESGRSGGAADEGKVEPLEVTGETKGKQNREHERKPEGSVGRELGSLSSGSANVLAQVYPSIQAELVTNGSPIEKETPIQFDATEAIPQEPDTTIFPPHPKAFFTSIQRPAPGSPVRFTSPSGRSSPAKLIPSLHLNDPTRTPARRIPIREAIAQGTASAQKLGQVNSYFRPNDIGGLSTSSKSPVFTRPALDDPLRSPAKRVPISKVFSSAKNDTDMNSRQGSPSPVWGFSGEKTIPVEHQQQWPIEFPKSSTSSRPVSKLPFPLVAAQPSEHNRPTSTAEESEVQLSPGVEVPDTPPTSSPAKSSLRQPSSSRIPRIGAKPYSRPTVDLKDQESKLPTVDRRTATAPTIGSATVRILIFFLLQILALLIMLFRQTKPSKPVRLVKSRGDDKHSSDESNVISSSAHVKGAKETSTSANLKRKRGTEKISPSQGRPVVLIRQVVPGMLGPKYAPTTTPSLPPSTRTPSSTHAETSPLKKAQRPIAMRRVVNKFPEKSFARDRVGDAASPDIRDEEVAGDAGGSMTGEDDSIIMVVKKSQTAKDSVPPSSSPILREQTLIFSKDTVHHADHRPSESSLFEDDAESSVKVRRTSRIRKQAPLNDVFTTPRTLQPRRKAAASSRSDADGFSGLSSVALKALTSSNTARNQLNFVSLATEVIRKDGRRPESPIMKVRTVSQREAERKSRGRSERAHRRARRSEDGMSDTDGCSSDRGDSSLVEGDSQADEDQDEDENFRLHKHRRGPGDEEDYETPAKPERPLKRPRFGENEESQDEIQEKKRVKWDRGLYSEIYLDEIEVKPKKRPKEDTIKKGCLAPTAKAGPPHLFCDAGINLHVQALRLDTLGNIINADSPLTDLVHENIVVKKFVYDNDLDPESPVVKTIRSRGKKAKS